jgi:sacsin
MDVLSPAVQQRFMDQIQPYRAFGADFKTPYAGTLFRLPLRTPEQAQTSRLSKQAHTPETILPLLHDFIEDAQHSLLFLKCVASIEVSEWLDGQPKPSVIWSCSIANASQQLISMRNLVSESVRKTQQAALKEKKLVYTKTESDYVLDISVHERSGTSQNRWMICTTCSGSQDDRAGMIASDQGNLHLRLVPWAGVAALLSRSSSSGSGGSGGVAVNIKGRSFCFLPLPAETGLPVHVNGYFELSSNRRDIWRGDDMAGEGRIRAEWNKALLEDVVAPTYARMLLRLCKSCEGEARDLEGYYRVWPAQSVSEPWASLVRRVYVETSRLPLLHSLVGGGRWVTPEEARYVSGQWEHFEHVSTALLEDGEAVVRVPAHVVTGFEIISQPLLSVSPGWLRQHYKSAPKSSSLRDTARAVRLLQFCLLDLSPKSAKGSQGWDAYACLVGLPLVPVCDGSLQIFRFAGDSNMLLLGTVAEYELLKALQAIMVDVALPPAVMDHFRSGALQSYTNVVSLSAELVAKCLGHVLPGKWHKVGEVAWTPGEDGQPTEAWLAQFWQYVVDTQGVRHFCEWPLLPTCDGTLCKLTESGTKVVDGAGVLGERLRSLLSRLGCRMLDAQRIPKKEALANFVHKATLRGVLAAIAYGNQGTMERVDHVLSNAPAADKRELRAFFSQRRWLNEDGCGREEAGMLLRLPIHEVHGQPDKFLPLDEAKFLPPAGAPSELLTAEYIRVEGDSETDMYRFLGIKTAKLTEFYAASVIPRLKNLQGGAGEAAAIMMLEQLPQLCREDARFWDRLNNLEFVTTASGRLARAWELYNPSVKELSDLLEGGDFYPAPAFLRPELLATLVRLGLQTSLDRSGVLKIARSISTHALGEGREDARVANRGKSLLAYLDKNWKALGFGLSDTVDDLDGVEDDPHHNDPFRTELCTLAWVPVLREAPNGTIPWPAGKTQRHVAPPCKSRMQEDAALVSWAYGICSVPVKSDGLISYLGWYEPVPPLVIAQQLLQYSSMYGTDSSVHPLRQPTTASRTLTAEVRDTIMGIYDALAMQTMSDQFDRVCAALRGQRCLLLDSDEFTQAERVAVENEADLSPLLHTFPESLSTYQHLFFELGVRQSFAARDYIFALQQLFATCGSQPLEPEQIVLAVRLAKEAAQHNLTVEERGMLCLPDAECRLASAESLVYNDAAWLSSTLQGVRFLHTDIPTEVAAALGLGSVRKLLLAGRVNVKDLTCPRPSALAKQLRRCAADHRRVLAGLLDTADCLGARTVNFLFDFRTHPSQSILQPNLACLQGPALVMHLDGVELTAEQVFLCVCTVQ